jgi:transcriptional regulator with XRE-family HTH domain
VSRKIQDEQRRRLFSRNVRVARERAHLTQADMAESMDMSETVYSRYERAQTWPSTGSLRRLCAVLGCSADVLLGIRELAADDTPPAPPQDPPRLRRLLRDLREARPETTHAAHCLLDVIAEHGALPAPDDDADDSEKP